jgi:hypothetical protein
VYFLSEQSRTTGRVLSIGGGRVARVALSENAGYFDAEITPERVAAHIGEIDDMDTAVFPDNNSLDLELTAQHLPPAGVSFSLDQESVSSSHSR